MRQEVKVKQPRSHSQYAPLRNTGVKRGFHIDKYHNYPEILEFLFVLHTHKPSYTNLNSPIYGLSIRGGSIFLFVFIIICILCHSKDGDQVREAEVLSLSHTISLISSTLSSKTCTIHQLKVIGSERESERKKDFFN